MSTVNVSAVPSARGKVEYELHGREHTAKRREHTEAGTTRASALSSDIRADTGNYVDSAYAFVQMAEDLAYEHNRKNQVRGVIQSFSKEEMDPTDPLDVQRVNDLGWLLAKELHPHSDALVITHTDGQGGHPHNHISVINHDNVTGRALTANRMHWEARQINDALMEREGHEVAARGVYAARGRHWEQQRDGVGLTAFEQWLGDTSAECLLDPRVTDVASYREALGEHGIMLEEREHVIRASRDGRTPEHTSIGWTYCALDTTQTPPRMRRRKASAISDEHTARGAEEIFAMKIEKGRQMMEERENGTQREGTSRSTGQDLVDVADRGYVDDERTDDRKQREADARDEDAARAAREAAARDARGDDEGDQRPRRGRFREYMLAQQAREREAERDGRGRGSRGDDGGLSL